MDGGSAFIEILIFGMVAAFLILRLRSVLGRRMGHERDQQPDNRPAEASSKNARQDDNVVALPGITRGNDPISRGIADIQQVDSNFDPDGFCVGARTAFELILSAYASGDRDTLRGLTGSSVFDLLDGAMSDREKREETLESTLVRIRSTDIVGAEMRGAVALVTLKIVSEQINLTRDSEGHAITGHQGAIDDVTDIWTFSRDSRSSDPNWALAEIQESEEASTET